MDYFPESASNTELTSADTPPVEPEPPQPEVRLLQEWTLATVSVASGVLTRARELPVPLGACVALAEDSAACVSRPLWGPVQASGPRLLALLDRKLEILLGLFGGPGAVGAAAWLASIPPHTLESVERQGVIMTAGDTLARLEALVLQCTHWAVVRLSRWPLIGAPFAWSLAHESRRMPVERGWAPIEVRQLEPEAPQQESTEVSSSVPGGEGDGSLGGSDVREAEKGEGEEGREAQASAQGQVSASQYSTAEPEIGAGQVSALHNSTTEQQPQQPGVPKDSGGVGISATDGEKHTRQEHHDDVLGLFDNMWGSGLDLGVGSKTVAKKKRGK